MTKLGLALKRAFPGPDGPRRVLRRLGLDADLLQSMPSMPSMPSSGSHDPAKRMRLEIEQMLGRLDLDAAEIAKILEVMDRHAPLDRMRGGAGADEHEDERAEHRVRMMRGRAGDDHDGDDLDGRRERLRSFLEQKGLSEDVVEHALEMLPAFPHNAAAGNLGGATPPGPRTRTSAGDRHASAAMDSFDARFGGGHISIGSPGGGVLAMDRRRSRPPTSAEVEAFDKRWPDSTRLVQR